MPVEKIEPGAPESQSADLMADNLAQLRKLFPELVTEGATGPAINIDVLKCLVGDITVTDADEKYGLNWHGKRAARQLALTPSTGTLRPCPQDSVDWDTTQNLMIEGDNLEVLKLLQKSYSGKVKLIYIDPPYNTGKDFVYPDNFRDGIRNYLELTRQTEGGRKRFSNTESSGRYHTDWLSMMYPRLLLARNLLSDDGAIFISIDDVEASNLQMLLTEVFGEENFRANISWQKRYTRSNNTVDFTTVIEHILVYSKSETFIVNLLERTKEADSRYGNPDNDPRGAWKGASMLNPATPQQRPNLCYPIVNPNSGQITNPTTNAWRRSKEEFERLQADNRLYWGSDGKQALPSIKMFLSEARDITPINFWDHGFAGNTDDGTRDLKAILGEKVFDNPKPVSLIERVIEHGADNDSIILDFFAGSGTTGEAVMRKNSSDGGRRRFILVQLPEPIDATSNTAAAEFCDKVNRPRTISEITKERLRRAGRATANANALLGGDYGYRTLSLDTSNLRPWLADKSDVQGSVLDFVEHLLPGRNEIDLLFEVIQKLGLDLASKINEKHICTYLVQSLGTGTLFTCLIEKIADEHIEELAHGMISWRHELDPFVDSTLILRDSAFQGDAAKLNFVSILEQHGHFNVKSI